MRLSTVSVLLLFAFALTLLECAQARTIVPRTPTPFNTPNLNAPHALPISSRRAQEAHARSISYEDARAISGSAHEMRSGQSDLELESESESEASQLARSVRMEVGSVREKRDVRVHEEEEEEEEEDKKRGLRSSAAWSRQEKRQRSKKRAAAAWQSADAEVKLV